MRIVGKLRAIDKANSPLSVNPIPTVKEYGLGRRSAWSPTSGCRRDAVDW
jgi:hypothetical protein